MTLIPEILQAQPEIRSIRRDIHAHPELCFKEERTSDVVAQNLAAWGIEVHRGLGTTGLVGVIRNGSSKRSIGLRADMDALPLQEANTFGHRSQHDGRMHACGHDGHTAMLLWLLGSMMELLELLVCSHLCAACALSWLEAGWLWEAGRTDRQRDG